MRTQNSKKSLKEEWAIVLDYLPHGKVDTKAMKYGNKPIVQLVGTAFFTLLEAIPKDQNIEIGERVYIGSGKREKIAHILGRINYNDLTAAAQRELPHIIEQLVLENESKFVDFFNNAMPINTRMHQLMLLPGLGKKHLWEILEEREVEPFKSFDDLKQRIKLIPDPFKMIVKRILEELKEEQKHYLFVNRD